MVEVMPSTLLTRLAALEKTARETFPEATEKFTSELAVYLVHIGAGASMRAIARARGGAPSTILRTIRRVETMREDPLLDQALEKIEADFLPEDTQDAPRRDVNMPDIRHQTNDVRLIKTESVALSRLSEPDAFLLVAKGAEKAGVFCRKNNFRRPLSLLSLASATRFVASDWVKCVSKTDLSVKYVITSVGRAAFRRHEAASGRVTDGREIDNSSVYARQHQLAGQRRYANPKTGEIETVRVNLGESPLGWLAKRKDANGEPLLSAEEVEAGERLREDFELAQIGPRIGQDWRRFLTPSDTGARGSGRTPSEGPMFARDRVARALEALGAGLADAALRICCFHEGLEATERRMGWSARSGKVVLKLALQRLVEHYELSAKDKAA